MSSLLRLISFEPATTPADRDTAIRHLRLACNQLPGLRDIIIGETIQPTLNGGDLIWRLEFATLQALDIALASPAWTKGIEPLFALNGPLVTQEHVTFSNDRSGGAPVKSGVYRIALFHANHSPTPERLERFATETAAMPRYIHSIRRWTLAAPISCLGTRPWTTVWEQEYDDRAGLEGPYLAHPVHWAHVDRWFDPEYPEFLVDPYLCHTYCEFRR